MRIGTLNNQQDKEMLKSINRPIKILLEKTLFTC